MKKSAGESPLVVDPSRADGKFAHYHCQTSSSHSRDAAMNETKNVFSKIGDWFRGANGREMDLRPDDPQQQIVRRNSFFRPWARRDAAINNLQNGFVTLTDLMSAIKDNLERQDHRNEELLNVLT